jgi:ATP-dependent exoDNAse (exonuclease V) alpha subunit
MIFYPHDDMLNTSQFRNIFLESFPYEPTPDQLQLIEKLAGFLSAPDNASVFVLKGYAGTGKTSVVSNLVKILPRLKANTVLLAPTGRAAKVLASYSGKSAFTIHRVIYQLKESLEGSVSFSVAPNQHQNTLFIVDEASMIAMKGPAEESSFFGSGSLLEDLISYVYMGDNCRLILIGDTAQLPPVKSNESPALNINFLKRTFHLDVYHAELKQVVRQEADSGILFNATLIRNKIEQPDGSFSRFNLTGFKDIKRLSGPDAADYINDAFSSRNFENSIVVCRSNKRANLYNQHIRQKVLYMEDEIGAGDLLMVVKNNYFWLPKNSHAGFIANGDIIEVLRIQRITEIYGFRFAQLTVRFLDYPNEADLDVTVMLDTLMVEGPSLTRADADKLWNQVNLDYADEPNQRKKQALVKANPWLNALQVKFAYALTCHKAQGGQWENVFVEMGYIPDNNPDHEYYRWLYTAITRATDNLYLMGFSDEFFSHPYQD